MASRRKLANFAQMYMQAYLQQKRAEEVARLQDQLLRGRMVEEDRLMRERSALEGEDQILNNLLTSMRQDPFLAQRFANERPTIGRTGISSSVLVPTRDQSVAGAVGQIGKIKERKELPGDITLEKSYAAQPGLNPRDPRDVEELIQARNAQRGVLEEADIYETSLQGKRAHEDALQTDLGKEEAAARNFPAVLKREKTRFSAMTPLEAGRAGAVRQAQLDVDFAPQNIAKRIDEYTKKAVAEAAAAGRRDNAKAAQEGASNSKTAFLALKQIKDAYDKVKLGPGRENDVRRLGRRLGTATGTLPSVNPDAAQVDALADGYSMLVYRSFSGTASQVSDHDLALMRAIIPFSYTLAEVGDEIFVNAARSLEFNPIIRERYGTQPFEFQMNVVNRWLELDKKARSVGATEFEDPFTPGATVPVIK